MNTIKLMLLVLFVLGLTVNVSAQNYSIGRAPVTQHRPVKRWGTHIDSTTIGYGSDGISNAWYSVDIPGGALINLGTSSGLHMGGDFDNSDTFYATRSPNTLIKVDYINGTETTIATITGVNSNQTITAMSWNPTNNTMYIGTTDLLTSQLYSLDLTTGTATFIGVVGQQGLIAMSFNCDGDLYSIDIITDDLWSIDPATGIGSSIGSLGFDANFAQDADFDFATGIMYLAAYNNGTVSGQLRSVDLTTGNTTELNDWGSLEITDFGIRETCGPPCPVGQPANPNPANGAVDVDINIGSISWDNDPNATYIEVYFEGTMIYSGAPVSTVTIPSLNYLTTYFWKVNEANDTCTVFGPIWTFKTMGDPYIFYALQMILKMELVSG